MTINNNRIRAAVLGSALALLSGAVVAAGTTTFAGDNVSYQFDAGDLGLFGSASVVGGKLVFTPAGFTADGTSFFTSETINVTVSADPGYVLAGFSLLETGSYTGDSAYATGTFTAIDIEGTTGNQLPVSFNGVNASGTWTAGALITLPASGWGGVDGVVTSVTLTLSNQLFAADESSILKDGVSISATALAVPEADTYAMLLAGLGLVGFMTRRRTGRAV